MSSSKLNLFTDNKPVSMSVKDWIIRKLAPKMLLSEKTIEAVINHQFQSANEALYEHKSLEMSGFGKFLFNDKKAVKYMAKLESQKELFERWSNDETLPEYKRKLGRMKADIAIENIKALKPKMYAFTDIRGMEEQFDSARETEEDNKGSEQGEIGNL